MFLVTEAIKVLKILRSDKAPLVKKRQAMRNTFGDYRQKIKEEEKKNATSKSILFLDNSSDQVIINDSWRDAYHRGIGIDVLDRVKIMVFNTTFNNISVISWWSVLLMEEALVTNFTI